MCVVRKKAEWPADKASRVLKPAALRHGLFVRYAETAAGSP